MNQVLIEKLNNILEVNLDKEHFGVKELAKEAGLSRSKLLRKLKSIAGKSSSRYIREFRLEKAMKLLQNNVATASEIAYLVGFGSPTYFNSCFHDYYGYPPGEVKFRNPIVDDIALESKNAESTRLSQITNGKKPKKKYLLTRRLVLVNSFVILLLSVVSYKLYQNYQSVISSDISNMRNKEIVLAMLPFKNLSNDIDNQYFVDGMMDDVLNHLSRIEGLVVKSTQSSEKYRESVKSTVEIGKELAVDYLLDGSVQKQDESARIFIQLVDAKTDKHLWSSSFDFELNQVFTVQSDISKIIAKELNTVISPIELEHIEAIPTENIEAYNLFLKGRFFWHRRTEEGLNKSIEYFKEALDLDPNYALAYAGLADSYQIMAGYGLMPRDEGYNKGNELAKKALAIDNSIAEAHVTLATILCYKDNNWEDSEKKFKLALSLNPNYASGHQFYAELLHMMGRDKEAREQIDIALSLNPNSFMMNLISAKYYMREGRFEEGLIYANKAKEIDNSQGRIYLTLAAIYVDYGKYNLATTEFENYYKLNPNTAEVANKVREAFNKSGIEGVYRVMIAFDFKSGYADKHPISQARQYAFINDTENAFKWLDIGYKGDASKIISAINNDKRFKKLKKENKYLELLNKIKLPDN